ncbi:MAG: M15 family metallopeptidase [Minisyncoccia bacterium]
MTLDEALAGKEIPEEIRASLALLQVPYLNFDRIEQTGYLVLHHSLTEEVREIFAILRGRSFPFEKIRPISSYGWSDAASMVDNNTVAFDYRPVTGDASRLSNHARGCAIDINPRLNPYSKGEIVLPPHARYDPIARGAVTASVAELFKSRGWSWGGDWTNLKDWQHFEKVLPDVNS